MRFPLFVSLAAVSLVSCASPESNDPGVGGAADRLVVGVSVLTTTHPFFLSLIEGMEEEARARGFELVVTSGEFDIARQQNQINDFIVRRVDAIALSPCDSRAVATTIRAANEAGIPVFTFDIAVLADNVDIATHVGIENREGGRQAARAAIDVLGGAGQIAIIDHPEVESVIQRTRGFRQEIEQAQKDGAGIEIVSVLPGSGAQDKSFRAAEDILQAHPEVDLIFGINDETALGALAAIERAGRVGQVRVIGFGGKQEALEAVRQGRLAADVVTYPREIGVELVRSISRYMSGEVLPAQTLIRTELVTSESISAAP